jgi:hypothetical protein
VQEHALVRTKKGVYCRGVMVVVMVVVVMMGVMMGVMMQM